MKLFCIDQFEQIGGGQRTLLDLLPAFRERGWESVLISPRDGLFSEAARDLGCRTEFFFARDYSSMRKPLRQIARYTLDLPRIAWRLDRLIREYRPGLVYINGPRYLPPAAFAAACRHVPVVFHCHSRLLQPSAIILAGSVLRLARVNVIACCRYAAAPLCAFIRPDGISLIYNGVGVPDHSPAIVSTRIRRIGVIGRIEPEKGQLEFVRAARLVLQSAPDCRFFIIGAPMFSKTDYYDRVVELSQGLPVEFTGWAPDIHKAFSRLDMLVVPSSRVEATTRVIVEAYRAGVPVVAFPSGGIPEILKDGETGFLASAASPEALARRILSVLQMRHSDLLEVVSRAKIVWQQNYTLEAFQQRVCEVLARSAAAQTAANTAMCTQR